jgi:hypothetical protein
MAVISKADYLVLSGILGEEYRQFIDAATLANSGLTYVVLLQDVEQEVDLLGDYYPHSLTVNGIRDGFPGQSRGIVTALQNHVINRSGLSINAWLPNTTVYPPAIQVSQDFADLSGSVGFTIDSGNIA